MPAAKTDPEHVADELIRTRTDAAALLGEAAQRLEVRYVRPGRDLPPFDPVTSDGCSIPAALRPFFPINAEARAACVRHDERYYRGGTRKERLRADACLLLDLIDAGVTEETAEKMFEGIRAFGGPAGHRSYSWAFGGGRFVYD